MPEVADNPSGLSNGRPHPEAAESLLTAIPTRLLPAGYTHLGAAREIAPTLREFGLDPDPIIRRRGSTRVCSTTAPASSRTGLWAGCAR